MRQLALFGAGAGAGSCAGCSSPVCCPSRASSRCGSCPLLSGFLVLALRSWSGGSLHSAGFRSVLAGLFSSRAPFLSVGRVSAGGGRGFSAVRCSCSGLVFQLFSGSRAGSFRVLPSSSSFVEGV